VCKYDQTRDCNVHMLRTTATVIFVTNFSTDFFLEIATEFADCDRKWSVEGLLVEIHFVIGPSQFATEVFDRLTFARKIF